MAAAQIPMNIIVGVATGPVQNLSHSPVAYVHIHDVVITMSPPAPMRHGSYAAIRVAISDRPVPLDAIMPPLLPAATFSNGARFPRRHLLLWRSGRMFM